MNMSCAVRQPSAWIGLPDAMLEIPYQVSLKTDTTRAVTFKNTMEGRRFGLLGTLSRRTWGMSVDPIESKLAYSLGMLSRRTATPVKPLRWYPHDAVIGNLLSPQATEWDTTPVNATQAGLVTLPDGSIARAVAHSGTGSISPGDSDGSSEHVVVQPGQPITFGVWSFGDVTISGFWRDRDGVSITNWTSGRMTHTGWQWRTFTITPPSTARLVNMSLFNGAMYARPSISWGTEAFDLPGRGCPKAVLHDVSEDLGALTTENWWGKFDATITEVG